MGTVQLQCYLNIRAVINSTQQSKLFISDSNYHFSCSKIEKIEKVKEFKVTVTTRLSLGEHLQPAQARVMHRQN